MRKQVILFMVLLFIPLINAAQNTEQLDFISPFSDGVAAIKKGNQWAFIDTDGELILDFRTDLVLTETGRTSYPIFNSNRCLIIKNKAGIPYYGYIDKTGKTVIEPQFLNARPFNENKAIALELVKEDLGKNEILNKEVYQYKYFEVVIDSDGKIKTYLTGPVYIGLSASNLRKPPVISSTFISENLIATRSKDKKWKIKMLNK
ncbi:WG repeat-containing protein [Lacinutrix sp. Hel_I_90]|uniref:WG repeat-containing protein n=1 Tax=Lacinutrix sp. Hel_I_90 TaxID=1249999 RepID=UPI0005C8AD0F|nr:WG repeat-containing protein [Lacinutrix sp. Hel_I_90]